MLPDDIDDVIDQWHSGTDPRPKDVPPHQYLGLRRDEYELWVREPDVLPVILVAHCEHRTVAEVIGDHADALPMAARGASAAKINALRAWLATRRTT